MNSHVAYTPLEPEILGTLLVPRVAQAVAPGQLSPLAYATPLWAVTRVVQ